MVEWNSGMTLINNLGGGGGGGGEGGGGGLTHTMMSVSHRIFRVIGQTDCHPPPPNQHRQTVQYNIKSLFSTPLLI